MFPLRQVRRSQQAPIITRALVLAMVLVFAWQIVLAQVGGGDAFFVRWGVRPRCVVDPEACHIAFSTLRDEPWPVLRRWLAPLLSSAFLHAGAAHLAFNAWFLWVFGPAVEEKLGRLKYLVFYAACAVASALAHIAVAPGSVLPLVGASGAIAGILGAHLVLMPRAWIVSYIPPLWVVPIPSLVFLIFWMAGQIAGARVLLPLSLGGVPASEAGGDAGIAWAAHIGGFAFGAFCVWNGRSKQSPRQDEGKPETPNAKARTRS
jgi:membrane associated rhomboid family serine protease